MIVKISKNIELSRGSAYRSALGRTRWSGFTLTELLVVIADHRRAGRDSRLPITGQVHGDRAPGGLRGRDAAGGHRHRGVSSRDNNDRMPGPIAANGQLPNHTGRSDTTPSGKTLFSQLGPHLGLEEKSEPTGLPDSLVCPAFSVKRFPGWNANGQWHPRGQSGNSGRQRKGVISLNQDLVLQGKRVFGPQDDQPSGEPTRYHADTRSFTPGNTQDTCRQNRHAHGFRAHHAWRIEELSVSRLPRRNPSQQLYLGCEARLRPSAYFPIDPFASPASSATI